MIKNAIHKNIVLSLVVLAIFSLGNVVSAYEIKQLEGIELVGDFVLNQAKVEVEMNPGDIRTKSIEIINRTSETRKFTVSVEDTGGTEDGSKAVVLYGEQAGPNSLKDFVSPEITAFTLQPREQITLPVTITFRKMQNLVVCMAQYL